MIRITSGKGIKINNTMGNDSSKSNGKKFQVAVLGSAGAIGQPLSLLLAMNEQVSKLNLYDVAPSVKGVAVDISHINVATKVEGFLGDLKDADVTKAALKECLTGCDVVVIPAGLPRKPGMSRDDLFGINAKIVSDLVAGVAAHCPKASVCIISNPVNSTVPIAAEVLKKNHCYNPKKLFGITTLDVLRSEKFVSEKINKNPSDLDIVVIGGHSGTTILPLLSGITQLGDEEQAKLITRIQNAGSEVVQAKAGAGSASLSMAQAANRFVSSLLLGLSGTPQIECAYVQSDVTDLPYFASQVKLGVQGVEEIISPLGSLSETEKSLLENDVKPAVKQAIQKGVQFVASL